MESIIEMHKKTVQSALDCVKRVIPKNVSYFQSIPNHPIFFNDVILLIEKWLHTPNEENRKRCHKLAKYLAIKLAVAIDVLYVENVLLCAIYTVTSEDLAIFNAFFYGVLFYSLLCADLSSDQRAEIEFKLKEVKKSTKR